MAKSEVNQGASAFEAAWPNVVPPPLAASSPPIGPARLGPAKLAQPPAAPPVSSPAAAIPFAVPLTAPSGLPLPIFPTSNSNAPTAITPISTGRIAPAPANVADDGTSKVDDDQLEDPISIATRLAPPWLLSSVLHMLILIILGLCIAANMKRPAVELEVQMVYSETLGDQVLDDSISISAPTPDPNVERTEVAISDLAEVADPFSAPAIAQLSQIAKTGGELSEVRAPAIGHPLSGRQAGRKSRLLGKYGGTAATESAVSNALLWLKRNQRADGSWHLDGPFQDGSNTPNPIAATAMALLAFQGAGHTHLEGEHKKVVERGWSYLLRQQKEDGWFHQDIPVGHWMYSHGQATIAICELYGMTGDAAFRAPAERAVQFCVRVQTREGGWKYTPGQGNDMSVTGWLVMALQSARMAGLEVPPQALEKVTKFIDSVSLNDGTRYVYEPGQSIFGPAMTAEALLCRQYLGWSRDDGRLKKGTEFLLEHPINEGDHNVYYWYYATQVVHHMEGEAWEKWNAVMREHLPRTQLKSGGEAGSWDPGMDRWGSVGGRLYVTCLSTYMLEVYYRHLPIYSKVFEKR